MAHLESGSSLAHHCPAMPDASFFSAQIERPPRLRHRSCRAAWPNHLEHVLLQLPDSYLAALTAKSLEPVHLDAAESVLRTWRQMTYQL